MTSQHALLATLVAANWTDDQIAAVTALSPQALRVIRASPLFRALVTRTRADLHAITATEAADHFAARLPKALAVYDDAMAQRDDFNAAIKAANVVTERTLGPPRGAEAGGVTIRLEPGERTLIERAYREIGEPITVDASPIPEGSSPVRTLEDAIAAAE